MEWTIESRGVTRTIAMNQVTGWYCVEWVGNGHLERRMFDDRADAVDFAMASIASEIEHDEARAGCGKCYGCVGC